MSSELPIALVDHGVVCVLSCFVIVKLLPLIRLLFQKRNSDMSAAQFSKDFGQK